MLDTVPYLLYPVYIIVSCWSRPPAARPPLTNWGRVTHMRVDNLTIIGSDNGLSPDRCQAINWSNAAILLIGPLGTNFSEILIKILTFSFKKMRLRVSSAKWRPFCLSFNVLNSVNVITQKKPWMDCSQIWQDVRQKFIFYYSEIWNFGKFLCFYDDLAPLVTRSSVQMILPV